MRKEAGERHEKALKFNNCGKFAISFKEPRILAEL